MKVKNAGIFDLDIKRPQVVLFGFGLNYQGNYQWETLLNQAKRVLAVSDDDAKKMIAASYSVFASSAMDFEDSVRTQKIVDFMEGYSYSNLDLLRMLSNVGADAYLTTNYTYDLENAIIADYSKSSKKLNYRYFVTSGRGTYEKRLTHTYNDVDSRKVWHIHGELDRKSSIILTLDDYLRQISDLVQHNKKLSDKVESTRNCFEIKSWIDYFLVGDVYILGFGMDYSENDIWWALCRRAREHGETGEVFYYPASKEECAVTKRHMLEALGVKIIDLIDVSSDEKSGEIDYAKFYQNAISDIENKVKVKSSKS